MNPTKYIMLMVSTLLTIMPNDTDSIKRQIRWIGGPTYILQLGSFKILVDPMLGPQSEEAFRIKKHPTTGELNAAIERYTDPAVFDTQGLDLLLVTHTHPDHIDRAAIDKLDKNSKAITTASGAEKMREWGFKNTSGLEWDNVFTLQKNAEALSITSVRARHAKEGILNDELGKVNGYIIEHTYNKKTYRIYATGDTVWFDEIKNYGRSGNIDLLIPNMGAVGNGERGLNAQACLKIIYALRPKKIIPVHHTTFSHYTEPISVLQNNIEKTRYKKRLKLIPLGNTVTL